MTIKYAINGIKIRESRSNRIYTHAVVKTNVDGSIAVLSCCGSLDLAQKAESMHMLNDYTDLSIVPLEVI